MSLTLYRMVLIHVQNPVTTNVGMLCIFKSLIYTYKSTQAHGYLRTQLSHELEDTI